MDFSLIEIVIYINTASSTIIIIIIIIIIIKCLKSC